MTLCQRIWKNISIFIDTKNKNTATKPLFIYRYYTFTFYFMCVQLNSNCPRVLFCFVFRRFWILFSDWSEYILITKTHTHASILFSFSMDLFFKFNDNNSSLHIPEPEMFHWLFVYPNLKHKHIHTKPVNEPSSFPYLHSISVNWVLKNCFENI